MLPALKGAMKPGGKPGKPAGYHLRQAGSVFAQAGGKAAGGKPSARLPEVLSGPDFNPELDKAKYDESGRRVIFGAVEEQRTTKMKSHRLSKFEMIKLRVTRAPKYKNQHIPSTLERDIELLEASSEEEEDVPVPRQPRDAISGKILTLNTKPRVSAFVEDQSELEQLEDRITQSMSAQWRQIEQKVPTRCDKKEFHMKSPSLAHFMSVTGCEDEEVSYWYLTQKGWDIERAVRFYFDTEGKAMPKPVPDFSGFVKPSGFVAEGDASNVFEHKPEPHIGAHLPQGGSLVSRLSKDEKQIRMLRHQHLKQTMALLSAERAREVERQRMLAAAPKKRRKRLAAKLAKERADAREAIQRVQDDNEFALAYKMSRMGMLR